MMWIKRQAGFTLVEIIIAMALFSIFIIATVGSFVAISKIQSRTILQRKAIESARLLVDDFTRVAFVSTSDTTKPILGGNGLTTLNSGDCTNTIQLTNRYKAGDGPYTFSLSNGVVTLQTGLSAATAITDNVSGTGSDIAFQTDRSTPDDCNVGTSGIFKYVSAAGSSAGGPTYVKLRFKVTAVDGSALFNGTSGLRVVTTVNLRTGEE